MKSLLSMLLFAGVCSAAILPEKIGEFDRGEVSKPALTDQAVWDEYGLKASETAVYTNGGVKFTATAWQLQDSTAGMAAFQWQRPADATAAADGKLIAQTKDSMLVAHGNYLLQFKGFKPKPDELEVITGALRNVDPTVLPTLPGFLPSNGLMANSERYVVGPATLQKFEPGIPPSVAALHTGAEAQIGVFHSRKGDLTLALFKYPSPQIAGTQTPEFEKLPGAMVKRSGPLLAVVLSPTDPDFAERVLGQVRYQAEVTEHEFVPGPQDNPRLLGFAIMNSFVFIGILLAFALLTGFFVGGFRTLFRRNKRGMDAEPMITLHLEQR